MADLIVYGFRLYPVFLFCLLNQRDISFLLSLFIFLFLRFFGCIFYKSTRDLTCPLEELRALKGLLHMLNATLIPTKVS